MSVELVRRLLDQKKWDLCSGLAEELMGGDISAADRAFLAFAACRSLSNQEKYSLALPHGQTATVLAEQIGDYDLLGKSLLELAFVQGLTPGHEADAAETLKRFLAHLERYPDALRQRTVTVYYNLGVFERSALRHAEALEHFRRAWEQGSKADNEARTERLRQDYCAQALMVGDMATAEKLIQSGEKYIQLHPQEKQVQVHVMVDKGWYNFLKNDYPEAIALMGEVVVLATDLEDAELLAQALWVWSMACERLNDVDSAAAMGMWAFWEAERSQRPELVAEIRKHMRIMRLRHPEGIDWLMGQMLQPAQ